MITNEIKKGWQIRLRDGSEGTMEDDRKGIIRTMKVPSLFGPPALGDNYIFFLAAARPSPNDEWSEIQFTDDQELRRRIIEENLEDL